jgi:sialate O-acetylesterase
MIAPLVPFAIEGVLWYQGEANASRAHLYRKLFPALITDWRNLWNVEFPFYYVQLPNLDRQPEPSKSGWAELREAQLMTLKTPGTGMAVTIDIGNPTNLHPENKQDVGLRLERIAEALTYKCSVEYSGPLFRASAIEGRSIRVLFDHADGLRPYGGTELTGFTIAGADRKFLPAEAKIDGASVIVSSDAVPAPVSVRYGWADNPLCNLTNGTGLPVSPFRTDDWPEWTFGKK